MSTRKSTGKRLRFEVFKRDHFTCQYCGAQPPDVVLTADHIDPVVLGGVTEIHNLITACEACNQGKSHRALTEKAIRPDADLLYLETQQEIAELRRYQAALVEREEAIGDLIGTLQSLWSECAQTDWVPSNKTVRELILKFSPEIAEEALISVGFKMAGGYIRSYGTGWVGYLFATARNLKEECN